MIIQQGVKVSSKKRRKKRFNVWILIKIKYGPVTAEKCEGRSINVNLN